MAIDVWGSDGLFRKAVQQKYANQGMNAATERMNADTNRMKAGNDLRLGLRSADIEQMKANTGQFSADTARGELAGRLSNSFRASDVRDFGLGNSFRGGADNGPSAVGSISRAGIDRANAEAGMGTSSNTDASGGYSPYRAPESTRSLLSPNTYYRGANNSFGSSPEAVNEIGGGTRSQQGTFSGSTPGPQLGRQAQSPAMRPLNASLRANGDNENVTGFRNSGVVMKPRMVRQPGYKNSGKVMGYADSGAGAPPDEYVEIRKQISKLAQQGDIDGATDLRMKLEALERGRDQAKPGYSDSGRVWPGVPDPTAPAVKTPREIKDEQFRRNAEAGWTGSNMQRFIKTPTLPTKLFENGGSAEGGLRSPKSFGPIGNVEDDTGRDTIDAVVRPGEYLLNPETVENGFGGGDYDKGVRKLDNIVRRATGKEPGPTMMSDDKPGFNLGGFVDDYGNLPSPDEMTASQRQFLSTPEGQRAMAGNLRQVQAEATAAAARTPPSNGPAGVPRRTYAQMAAEDRAKRTAYSERANAAAAERPESFMERARNSSYGRANIDVAPALKKVGNAALKGTGWVANKAITRGVPGLGVVLDSADVVDVATDPNMTGGDVANEVFGKAGKWSAAAAGALAGGAGGAAVGGPFAPITAPVGALIGGGAAYFLGDKLVEGGRASVGTDTRDPSERSNGMITQWRNGDTKGIAPVPAEAAAPNEPAKQTAPSIWDSYESLPDSQQQAQQQQQQPTLRDFLENQYRTLAADNRAVGSLTRVDQMKNIGDMINSIDQSAAVTDAANFRAVNKARENNLKRIDDVVNKGFIVIDPETGEQKVDSAAANEFRQRWMAGKALEGGDFGSADPDALSGAIPEFIAMRGLRDEVNRQARTMGNDGVISSDFIRPEQIVGHDDLRLSDAWRDDSSATFVDDVLPSLFKKNEKVLLVNLGGKTMRMPLSEILRLQNGGINLDIISAMPELLPPEE